MISGEGRWRNISFEKWREGGGALLSRVKQCKTEQVGFTLPALTLKKKKNYLLSSELSLFRQIKRDVKNEKHKELQELVDKVICL